MSKTTVLPTDPQAVKVWSAKVAVDSVNKMYFGKMTGTEADAMPVVIKTDLEAGPGDEVTTVLIAKLRGKPVEGDEKAAGREDKLAQYTHKMRIDKHRKLVNVGDVMAQKRVKYSLDEQVRNRLSDYMAEVSDQRITMYASGGRGVGNEIQHYPIGYAGFPNAFQAPDADHLLVGEGQAQNTLTTTMSTKTIDIAIAKAKKFYGGENNSVAMTQIEVEGGKHFVLLLGVEQMFDLRREVGDAGWLTLEKAKATQDGAKNPIFTGGAAYYNGVLIDEVQHYVRFNNYGAGGNTNASRAMFLGAHAVSVCYGTKAQKKQRYELSESDMDHGEEAVVITRMIEGVSKTQFNNRDFGVISVDTAYTPITGS